MKKMQVLQRCKKLMVNMIPAGWRRWITKRIQRERREIWIFDSVNEPLERLESAVPVEFGFGDRETLEEVLADQDLGISEKWLPYYSALLCGKNRLFVGRHNGQIVFYGGVMCEHRSLPRGAFLLESDEFYIVACFTRAGYRGRGIYPAALRDICRRLGAEGYRRGYVDVATYNAPSIRGIAKAGAKRSDSDYQQIHFFGYEMSVPQGPLRPRFSRAACPSS